MFTLAFAVWDGDRDLDLIVGLLSGRLTFFERVAYFSFVERTCCSVGPLRLLLAAGTQTRAFIGLPDFFVFSELHVSLLRALVLFLGWWRSRRWTS